MSKGLNHWALYVLAVMLLILFIAVFYFLIRHASVSNMGNALGDRTDSSSCAKVPLAQLSVLQGL